MTLLRKCLALILLPATAALAAPQLAPQKAGNRKFNEKPLWTMWTTGFSEQGVLSYASRVVERAGLSGKMGKQIKQELDSRKKMPKSSPIKGTMMFMVVGFPPGVETLEFLQLKDAKEFETTLERRKKEHWGSDKKLEGAGDLRELVWTTQSYVTEEFEDENGNKRYRAKASPEKTEQRIYFRLHDGVLFESRFPELHDMDLPDRKELGMGRRRRDEDLYFHADLTVVPKGLKEIFHKIMVTEANRYLQQRDTEQLAPYEFRKSASKLLMELLRSGTFDVDQATGYIKFATETDPVRGRFNVKVRNGSALSRQLAQVAKGRTALPVDEDSVLSLRSTWSMPPAFKTLLAKAGPYLKALADAEKDAYAKAGLQYVAYAIEETGKRGQFETAMHFGGNAASGPTMYGAVRVEKSKELVAGLEALMLTSVLRSNGTRLPQISDEEHNGRKYVRVTAKDLDWPLDMKPECVFLTPSDKAIWFAVGDENAWAILDDRIDGKNRQRASSMLLDLKLNLDRFLTEDDPAGLDKFGQKLDVELDKLMPGPMQFRATMKMEPDAVLDTVLANAGRTLKLSLDPTPSGFAVAATVDQGLADYALARVIAAQNRMMLAFEEEQKKGVEEARQQAKEAKKAANAAEKAAIELRKAVEKAEKQRGKAAKKKAGKANEN